MLPSQPPYTAREWQPATEVDLGETIMDAVREELVGPRNDTVDLRTSCHPP